MKQWQYFTWQVQIYVYIHVNQIMHGYDVTKKLNAMSVDTDNK